MRRLVPRRRRNVWGETWRQEFERRTEAMEIHIQDLEQRYAELENRINALYPAPENPPEGDSDPFNPSAA